MTSFSTSRRSFLRGTALGAGGLIFGGFFQKKAHAQVAANRKFIFAYFEGGWDILLGLDPRDPAATTPAANQIDPAYGQLAAPYRDRGVQRAGALSFGPAVPPALIAHAGKMSIVNAIGMDTASHEAGRRYFITGRFPRGISAVGSSTAAEIAAQMGDHSPIPHISAGVEAYATGLPPHASALNVNSIADLIVALTPFVAIDPTILTAVESYQDQKPGCGSTSLDRDGLSTNLLRSQKRAREYIRSQLDRVFDLQRADEEMVALRNLYRITSAEAYAPDSPEILSFVAGQAVKKNISQCVSVRVAGNLDTHSNWAQDHAPRQERGWNALAALISDLEATPGSGGSGSMLDETTIVAFSEFGRTPMFNNLRGRDHFLGNSCLLAGAGFKRGVTIGKSASVGMMPLETRVATGEGVERPSDAERDSGAVVALSPKHVLATLLTSAGLDASYLRTEALPSLLP